MSARPDAALAAIVEPRARDLGGFEVGRLLPAAACRAVGPFVFLDRFGPATLGPDAVLDVAPHPHIGLATLTYLFDGEILHRDSLGSVQPIRPGSVNWMVAGRGVVHSERTPPALREVESGLFGLQSWVALPRKDEEVAPDFQHVPAEALPEAICGDVAARLVAGTLSGRSSPVRTLSPLFYADASLAAGETLILDDEHEERAAAIAVGCVEIAGQPVAAGQVAAFAAGGRAAMTAREPSRVVVFGGAPLDGRRHLWWNFVSTSRERIEQAKADWRAGRFSAVPGDDDRIPLPE